MSYKCTTEYQSALTNNSLHTKNKRSLNGIKYLHLHNFRTLTGETDITQLMI